MAADCTVCRIIRIYLLFAVPLIALVGVSTMEEGFGTTPWFARVELIDLMSWGCLAALISITVFRAYEEYYLPRKRERALAAAKARFDEIVARSDEPSQANDGSGNESKP